MLVAGDPVGPDEACPSSSRESCAFAETRGLRFAALGASERVLEVYRDAGLRAIYLGDEAIVDTRTFSLEGRAIRKVRQSVHRLEAAGYRVEAIDVESSTTRTLDEIEDVSALWRDGAAERGFSMAMDSLRGGHQAGGVVVAARDADGAMRGFIHFVPSYGRPAMSLSLMRRDRETPNGLMEFLVVRRSSSEGARRRRDLAELRRVRALARAAGRPSRAAAGPGNRARQPVLPDREPASLQRQVRAALGTSLPGLRASPLAAAGRAGGDENRGPAPEAPVRPRRTAALFSSSASALSPGRSCSRSRCRHARSRPLGPRVGRLRPPPGGVSGRDWIRLCAAGRRCGAASPLRPERLCSRTPGSTSSRRAPARALARGHPGRVVEIAAGRTLLRAGPP